MVTTVDMTSRHQPHVEIQYTSKNESTENNANKILLVKRRNTGNESGTGQFICPFKNLKISL